MRVTRFSSLIKTDDVLLYCIKYFRSGKWENSIIFISMRDIVSFLANYQLTDFSRYCRNFIFRKHIFSRLTLEDMNSLDWNFRSRSNETYFCILFWYILEQLLFFSTTNSQLVNILTKIQGFKSGEHLRFVVVRLFGRENEAHRFWVWVA